MYCYIIAICGLAPVALVAIFIRIRDPPGKAFIYFFNVSSKILCDLSSQVHNNLIPLHSLPILFSLRWTRYLKKGVIWWHLPHLLVTFVILFMQAAIPPICCWKTYAFIASSPFWISRYNIVPYRHHTVLFNSFPNGLDFLNINK